MTKKFTVPIPGKTPDITVDTKVTGRLESTKTKISFTSIEGLSFVLGAGRVSTVVAEMKAKGKDRIIESYVQIKAFGITVPKHWELQPYKIP